MNEFKYIADRWRMDYNRYRPQSNLVPNGMEISDRVSF